MYKRILVIEQSRTIQTLLTLYFKDADHQVLNCQTPLEALRILPGLLAAPPDMIFLAIDREKEAYKVTTYLKEHSGYTNTQLVAMVLKEEQADVKRTLNGLQVSYLVKPFHIQEAMALVSAPLPGTLVEHAHKL